MGDLDVSDTEKPGTPPRVLVVGECLVDLAPVGHGSARGAPGQAKHFQALPGGGPANVALGLARLGVATAFAGRFSATGFGPWLRQHLVANDVDLHWSVGASEPATLAVVTLDQRGQAAYTFYGPETADWQWRDAELPRGTNAAGGAWVGAVHTGSLATTFEPGATVLARWLDELREARQVVISFDPNVRPSLLSDIRAFRRKLEGMVAAAHIVKASNEDISSIYPGASPLEVAEEWLGAGAELVMVTEGDQGATALHRNGLRARCTPPAVKVVDTIGAGDSFTAGLLAFLAEEGLLTPSGVAGADEAHVRGALAQAVTVSAMTCTRAGADPPTREEVVSFRERLPT